MRIWRRKCTMRNGRMRLVATSVGDFGQSYPLLLILVLSPTLISFTIFL